MYGTIFDKKSLYNHKVMIKSNDMNKLMVRNNEWDSKMKISKGIKL